MAISATSQTKPGHYSELGDPIYDANSIGGNGSLKLITTEIEDNITQISLLDGFDIQTTHTDNTRCGTL